MQIVFSRRWLAATLCLGLGFSFFRLKSDGSLVRAAKARDREAFQELMSRYAEPLRKFASRRLPSAEVEDALQETWITIWERIGSLEEERQFRPWAFTICIHKIHDHWRRSTVRATAADGLSEEPAYFPKAFAQVELRESFAEFWADCQPEQREVIGMYYADGLTLKEISQILGRNLNTVKYQFYRAHELAESRLPSAEIMLREVGR
jgi:RNA polymerase sigma-70 factor (ECF subfamily)